MPLTPDEATLFNPARFAEFIAAAVAEGPPLVPTWVPFGEPGVGGRMTGFAVSPHDTNRVIVTGDMLGIGLSEDRGKTWQSTSGLPSWEMAAVTFHPTDPKVIWAGSMSGPVKSTDGGRTWTVNATGLPAKANGGFPYTRPVERVLIDPSDTTHLLAFMGNNRSWKTSTSDVLNYGRVYESTNSGDSWTLKGTIGSNLNVTAAVAASSANLTTLYASISTSGVYKSTDSGANWTQVNTGLPHTRVRHLASNGNGVIWASLQPGPSNETGGVYRTDDAGANWTAKITGLGQNTGAGVAASYGHIHRASDGTLYTADLGIWGSGQRIYKSTDDGNNWANISPAMSGTRFFPAGVAPYWITSDPHDPGFLVAGTSDVMIASEDAGATWYDAAAEKRPNGRWRGTGFSGLLTNRVTFSPYRKGLVLATSFDAGNLLRSEDASRSWHKPTGLGETYGGAYDVAVGGLHGEVVAGVLGQANVFNGIVISTDWGATFARKEGAGVGLPAKAATQTRAYGSVSFGSRDGSVIYAVLPSGDLYKSTDTGVSWTLLKSDLECYTVAVSPSYGTVYLGTTSGLYAGDGSSSGSFTLVAAHPRATRLVFDSEGTLYACAHKTGSSSSHGLWRFEPTTGALAHLVSGSTIGQYIRDVAVDPLDPNRIVYVTQDDPFNDTSNATGIWLSQDRLATAAAQINTGLPMLRIRSVAFDPWTHGKVVVGSDGRGMWTTNLVAAEDTVADRLTLTTEVLDAKATLSSNPADVGKTIDAYTGQPITAAAPVESGLPTVQYDGATYPSRPDVATPVMFVGPASAEPASQQLGDLWFAEDAA